MRIITRIAVLASLALGCVAVTAAQSPVQEPGGYRNDDYRAPVPASLRGARVITTSEAKAIWEAGSGIFIDVMPQAPRPANLPPGTIWRDRPRLTIPRSVWLPDTGYGE
jgi:PQQ-dependent catabolism-associated CXXCW motif protein